MSNANLGASEILPDSTIEPGSPVGDNVIVFYLQYFSAAYKVCVF